MAYERPKNNQIAVSLDQKTVLRSNGGCLWSYVHFFFFTKYESLVITSLFINGFCSIA